MLCFECENASNANLLTVSNQHICADCNQKYYLDCTDCKKAVPKEETLSKGDDIFCPNCFNTAKVQKLSSFENTNLDELIAEYIELNAKEKELKNRSDEIKEIFKSIAENEQRINNAVLLKSESGTIKCSYRQTRKCENNKVLQLKENLEPQLFEMLFKTEFKLSKDFQDNLTAVKDTFDDELADLVNSAVIVTESPTLTIEK